MNITGIIPARYNSQRFPGKPLVDIMGKSMIQRVYEQALKVKSISQVVIATDDKRIFDHATALGMNVQMTKDSHKSGTDRCAEVVREIDTDVVVNIQGDEPFVEPMEIETLISCFKNESCRIATLVSPIRSVDDYQNVNRVKCVIAKDGRALYFSRAPIPYNANNDYKLAFKHVGLYAYKKDTLLELSELTPGSLEESENLEQLRWLENGYDIHTAISNVQTPNVDTPEDLEMILKQFK